MASHKKVTKQSVRVEAAKVFRPEPTGSNQTTDAAVAAGRLGPVSNLGQDSLAAAAEEIQRDLGLDRLLFSRMVGGTNGQATADRLAELKRLAEMLRNVMRPEFIPKWLVTPIESLGGISPVEAIERGEDQRLWKTVFFIGSGLPV